MLKEVDDIGEDKNICPRCKGSGYEPSPSEDEINGYFPNPVPCRECFGSGSIEYNYWKKFK